MAIQYMTPGGYVNDSAAGKEYALPNVGYLNEQVAAAAGGGDALPALIMQRRQRIGA